MKEPLIYFPSKTVFIDDEQNFLENLIEEGAKTKSKNFALYTNPLSFLEDMKGKKFLLNEDRQILSSQKDTDDFFNFKSKLNIKGIRDVLLNRQRFEYLSTIVIDYSMEAMNGIEALSRIGNPLIKKILLTGEADANIAVDAFNKGLIHSYIRKNSPDMRETLFKKIESARKEYFSEISSFLVKSITESDYSLPNVFLTKEFWDFFYNLVQQENIVEYYLLDSIGSFLLINNKNQLQTLMVKSADGIEADILEIQEEPNIPANIKTLIKNKEKMLSYCLDKDKSLFASYEDWQNYLFDCKNIDGTDFYYSLAASNLDIDLDEIKFFEPKIISNF